MKKSTVSILTFLLAAMTFSGCSRGGGDTITVMLDWVVNTNHTGLYVALDKGYFDEEGVEVDIRERGQDASLVVVGEGMADFGISAQEQVTFARTAENPQPVVAVAAILQRNTTAFVSLADKNILTPKDFEGKIYGNNNMPTDLPILEALMRIHGGDAGTVESVGLGMSDLIAALETEIDFIKIFRGWQGVQAELHGVELNYIMIGEEDARFDNYTPLIISNENYLSENPEQTKKFLRAVSRGYEFAANDPQAAAEILLKYTPETDSELIERSLAYLSGYYTDGAGRFGYMMEEIWTEFAEFCTEYNITERELDVNAAFTNEYLP